MVETCLCFCCPFYCLSFHCHYCACICSRSFATLRLTRISSSLFHFVSSPSPSFSTTSSMKRGVKSLSCFHFCWLFSGRWRGSSLLVAVYFFLFLLCVSHFYCQFAVSFYTFLLSLRLVLCLVFLSNGGAFFSAKMGFFLFYFLLFSSAALFVFLFFTSCCLFVKYFLTPIFNIFTHYFSFYWPFFFCVGDWVGGGFRKKTVAGKGRGSLKN